MDLSKLRPSGAAAVSGVVLALWAAHSLGVAPALPADQAELLKASVYAVTGYWVGASKLTAIAPAAALAAPLVPAAVSELESLVEGTRRG